MSVHGVGECHDVLTGGSGHFKQLLRSMEKIREKTSFRFNVVMNRFNITDLPKIANLAVEFGVRIVNFINFNPHNVWKEHTVECGNIIANLREVEPVLNEIIPYLEDNNVGVNVRYYPMCRIKEEYRRTISNDLHVLFDPYEWDYGTLPKTFDTFMRRAVDLSHCNEESNEPCNNCQLKNICGGINKHFNSITRRGLVDKVTDFEGDTEDFYWYRKYNWRTLHER
jgi:MoaA/NifB/PqqE/SkfB family radical SAM enzyme